jgi:cohesin loading factor subunit SCC2
MSTLVWAQELHAAIKKSASVVEKLAQENDEEAVETREKLQMIQTSLRKILSAVWSAEDNNVFEVS